jgi:serine protease Do
LRLRAFAGENLEFLLSTLTNFMIMPMMRRLFLCGLFLFLVATLGFTAEQGRAGKPSIWVDGDGGHIDPVLDQLGRALTQLADKAQPSVVDIRVRLEPAPPAKGDAPMPPAKGEPPAPRSKRGSGFINSADGYILTANHVVSGGVDLEVRLPNRQRIGAKVIATDSVVDLAIIKVDKPQSLIVLPLGDSDSLKVGEPVMAMGYPNPTASDGTSSLGVIGWSTKSERNSLGFDLIQTDAGASPGVSGGPLINMRGHVVGMITRASPRGHIGFAVPINIIKTVVPRLLEGEKIAWGWLGVRTADVTSEVAESSGLSPLRGVLISSVLPGHAAESAGVLSNDIILAVNGIEVDSPREFSRMIGGSEAGQELTLKIFRKGETLELTVRLGTRPITERREG